jgi:hypothetical protein
MRPVRSWEASVHPTQLPSSKISRQTPPSTRSSQRDSGRALSVGFRNNSHFLEFLLFSCNLPAESAELRLLPSERRNQDLLLALPK